MNLSCTKKRSMALFMVAAGGKHSKPSSTNFPPTTAGNMKNSLEVANPLDLSGSSKSRTIATAQSNTSKQDSWHEDSYRC